MKIVDSLALSAEFESRLASDQTILAELTYPSQEFPSATEQLAGTYPAISLLTIGFMDEVIARFTDNPNVGQATTIEELDKIIELQSYRVVRTDNIHAIYSGMGALATGTSMARGDVEKTKLGLEFGKRVTDQRALLAAHALLVTNSNLRAVLDIEGFNHDIHALAARFHDRTGRRNSPLLSVPKKVGLRYDQLAGKIYDADALDSSRATVFDLSEKRRPGFRRLSSKRMGFEERTKEHLDGLTDELGDQETAVAAIEEIYDTYLGAPVLKITDEEVAIIGSFTNKIAHFYEIAGRFTTDIGKDRRVAALSFLVARLSKSWRTEVLRRDYARTAAAVNKNEEIA